MVLEMFGMIHYFHKTITLLHDLDLVFPDKQNKNDNDLFRSINPFHRVDVCICTYIFCVWMQKLELTEHCKHD